jgi:hypothetical protein
MARDAAAKGAGEEHAGVSLLSKIGVFRNQ